MIKARSIIIVTQVKFQSKSKSKSKPGYGYGKKICKEILEKINIPKSCFIMASISQKQILFFPFSRV